MHRFIKSRWFYPVVFLLCAWPLAALLKEALPVLLPEFYPDLVLPWEGDLGVNPVEMLLHETGRDALMLLIAALAVTPIRRITGWNRVQIVRRTVGVWSFVYALLHFATYAAFDKVGDVAAITEDVLERRFIFVGMLAFVILFILTITSTNGMIRRLGRRWQKLHRLAYVAAIAGAVHFVWGQKADIREPLIWAGALSVLFAVRVVYALRKVRSRPVPAVSH
jgi:methionine sulfoxide reductase heme-binding subunit